MTRAELVLDASVAGALLFNEEEFDAAAIFRRDVDFIAPDFILLEVASGAAKRVWRGELSIDLARDLLDTLASLLSRRVAISELTVSALTLSAQLKCSVYDASYLALALADDATLITDDRRFADLAEAGGYARYIERAR